MILELENVVVKDPRSNEVIVHGSSFVVSKNKCLSIVGESGSGKSTLANIIMKLEKADSGTVIVPWSHPGHIMHL